MFGTSGPQWGALHCNLYILVLFLGGSGVGRVRRCSGRILPALCMTTLSVRIFGSDGIASVRPYRALHFRYTFGLLGGHCRWLTLLPPVCSTRYPSMRTFPGAYLSSLAMRCLQSQILSPWGHSPPRSSGFLVSSLCLGRSPLSVLDAPRYRIGVSPVWFHYPAPPAMWYCSALSPLTEHLWIGLHADDAKSEL